MIDVFKLYGFSWRAVRACFCWYLIGPVLNGARLDTWRGRLYLRILPYIGDFGYAGTVLEMQEALFVKLE